VNEKVKISLGPDSRLTVELNGNGEVINVWTTDDWLNITDRLTPRQLAEIKAKAREKSEFDYS
jgi:hypothetical protein